MSETDLTAKIDEVITQGRAEYPDFDERSAFVVGIGAHAGELRQALAELGPDAHRVVASLADDPEEAARILALRGAKLGTAISRYAATKAKAPVPALAPKEPAKPAVDISDPELPMKEYARLRDAHAAEQRGRKPAATDVYNPKISIDDYVMLRDQQERERRAARRFR